MKGLFWLSFCDPKAPADHQFLGGCVVEGEAMVEAVGEAKRLGINPGGEVMGVRCEDLVASVIPEKWKNRLLTREEALAFDEELGLLLEAAGANDLAELDTHFLCSDHNEKPS